MTDIASTTELLARLLTAGTVARLNILDTALREAEQRGADAERARIRADLQNVSSNFIADLATHQ